MEFITNQMECKRCGHEWIPRKNDIRQCPGCRSCYFDTPLSSPPPKKPAAASRAGKTHRKPRKVSRSPNPAKYPPTPPPDNPTADSKENTLKAKFNEAREVYPGSKSDLNTEYSNFKAKNPDYRACTYRLYNAILTEIKLRESFLLAGKQLPKPYQDWIPFSDWINKRKWNDSLVDLM